MEEIKSSLKQEFEKETNSPIYKVAEYFVKNLHPRAGDETIKAIVRDEIEHLKKKGII